MPRCIGEHVSLLRVDEPFAWCPNMTAMNNSVLNGCLSGPINHPTRKCAPSFFSSLDDEGRPNRPSVMQVELLVNSCGAVVRVVNQHTYGSHRLLSHAFRSYVPSAGRIANTVGRIDDQGQRWMAVLGSLGGRRCAGSEIPLPADSHH